MKYLEINDLIKIQMLMDAYYDEYKCDLIEETHKLGHLFCANEIGCDDILFENIAFMIVYIKKFFPLFQEIYPHINFKDDE